MDEAQTIAGMASLTCAAPADASPLSPSETFRRRLLASVDQEITRSFTEVQLLELERVLAPSSARHLPVDVRISVPLFRRRYFMTILAGPEHRSAERLKADRAKHAIATTANICFFAFLLTMIVPTMIGLYHIINAAG